MFSAFFLVKDMPVGKFYARFNSVEYFERWLSYNFSYVMCNYTLDNLESDDDIILLYNVYLFKFHKLVNDLKIDRVLRGVE